MLLQSEHYSPQCEIDRNAILQPSLRQRRIGAIGQLDGTVNESLLIDRDARSVANGKGEFGGGVDVEAEGIPAEITDE